MTLQANNVTTSQVASDDASQAEAEKQDNKTTLIDSDKDTTKDSETTPDDLEDSTESNDLDDDTNDDDDTNTDTDDNSEKDKTEDDSADSVAIKKLRKESAKYRTERNEALNEIEALKEAKESDSDNLATAIQERDEALMLLTKVKISYDMGIPVDLLPDGDEETIKEQAQKLKGWKGSEGNGPVVNSVGEINRRNSADDIARAFLQIK